MNNLLKISRFFFCFGGSDHVSPRRFRPAQAASTDPTGSVETPRGARSRGAGAEGENRAKGQGSQGQDWVVVSDIFYFHPYLGRWSNLTNIFQMGWNHQLEEVFVFFWGVNLILMLMYFYKTWRIHLYGFYFYFYYGFLIWQVVVSSLDMTYSIEFNISVWTNLRSGWYEVLVNLI